MRLCICAILLLTPAVIYPQHKNKQPKLPAIFGSAQTIYVEAWGGDFGDAQSSARKNPEERKAIEDIQDELRRWNRYTLVKRREDAELVIWVIKKQIRFPGNGPDSDVFARQGIPGNAIPGARREEDATIQVPDDIFEVRMVLPNGELSGPIWQQESPLGLDAPQPRIFMKFKDAVERAYPSQPAVKQAAKP